MAVRYQGTTWGSTNNDLGADVVIGDFSSAAAGAGIPVSASKTKVVDICCDDGAAVLASGTAARAERVRMLVKGVQTGNVSLFAQQRQVKVTTDCSGVSGHLAAGWDYLECSSTAVVNGTMAATYSMVDLPSGAVIASAGYLAGVLIGSNDLGGTHTGKAVGIHFQKPVAGTFDAVAKFDENSGISTQTGGTLTITKKLAIYDDAGNLIYIPCGTIA